MNIPELLCPAGSRESLEAALHFGADAVYAGMKRYGLRAFAGNFDGEELRGAGCGEVFAEPEDLAAYFCRGACGAV